MADAVSGLIEIEGLSDADRRLLAYGIVGLAEGASRHWLANDAEGDPDALAGRVAELAWAGLRGVRTH